MEEVGHHLEVGLNDDVDPALDSRQEVYSGDITGVEGPADETPERVRYNRPQCNDDSIQEYNDDRTLTEDWSKMAVELTGASDVFWSEQVRGQYTPYSIEELLTIENT